MNIKIPPIHGELCFFFRGSYNCPRLGFYGFSSERALSRRIATHKRILAAQSVLAREYTEKLVLGGGK